MSLSWLAAFPGEATLRGISKISPTQGPNEGVSTQITKCHSKQVSSCDPVSNHEREQIPHLREAGILWQKDLTTPAAIRRSHSYAPHLRGKRRNTSSQQGFFKVGFKTYGKNPTLLASPPVVVKSPLAESFVYVSPSASQGFGVRPPTQ